MLGQLPNEGSSSSSASSRRGPPVRVLGRRGSREPGRTRARYAPVADVIGSLGHDDRHGDEEEGSDEVDLESMAERREVIQGPVELAAGGLQPRRGIGWFISNLRRGLAGRGSSRDTPPPPYPGGSLEELSSLPQVSTYASGRPNASIAATASDGGVTSQDLELRPVTIGNEALSSSSYSLSGNRIAHGRTSLQGDSRDNWRVHSMGGGEEERRVVTDSAPTTAAVSPAGASSSSPELFIPDVEAGAVEAPADPAITAPPSARPASVLLRQRITQVFGFGAVGIRRGFVQFMNATGVWTADEQTDDAARTGGGNIWGNNTDDDPLCHIILCLLGFFVWRPFPWLIGSFLFCVTPKENRKSRSVGLLSVLLGTATIIWTAIAMYYVPMPVRGGVLFLSHESHLGAGGSTYSPPGRVWSSSEGDSADPAASTAKFAMEVGARWTGLKVNPQLLDGSKLIPTPTAEKDYIGTKRANGEVVMGPASLPLDPDVVFQPVLLLGPSFNVEGRILLFIEFGRGGRPSSQALLRVANTFLSPEQDSIDVAQSPFPNSLVFKGNIADDGIPSDFLGGGLRCWPMQTGASAEQAHWVLGWKGDMDVSSSIIVFRALHQCQLGLVDTVRTGADAFIDIRQFTVEPLS